MKRFLLAATCSILLSTPAWADSLGSVTGGQAGNQSNMGGCINQSPTPAANQQVALSCDGSGNLKVNASVSATVTVAPLTSTNLAGSISVTNTFQSIQVSTAGRNGCLVQNQSTANSMWVYFGAIGGATKAKSFILDTSHGLAISCSVGGLGVATDQVSITGTSGDLFNANVQ